CRDSPHACLPQQSRFSLLSPKISEVAVADQLATLLVPESEGEGFETGKERDGLHALKQRLCFVALLQVIIGNPRTQMMNVVKPDVAGEPLHQLGQFVERTALQVPRSVITFPATFPIDPFNLMLDVT